MFHKLKPNVHCIYSTYCKKGLPLQNNLTFVQHPAATCLRFICWSSEQQRWNPDWNWILSPPSNIRGGTKKVRFCMSNKLFMYEDLSESSNYFNQVNKIVRNFFETRCSSPVTSTHLSSLTPLLPPSSPSPPPHPPKSMHK